MSRRGAPGVLTLAALLASLGTAPDARADDKQQCVAASEKAQQLRNAGKLSEAREQLALCGRAECPKIIQQDCTQWMSEVLSILPSIVPGARDRRGRDLVDVQVSVDGKVVTEHLDGKPVAVDPGVHVFRFEAKGAQPVEEQIVVRQGEKNRILTITIPLPTDEPEPGPKGGPTPAPAGAEPSSPPIAAYIVGGLGLATLGAALYINLDANSDARELRDTCAPKCEQSKVDEVDQRYTIAGITAGVGGALLITGVVLFFVHGSGDSKPNKALVPMITPSRYGGSALFRF